MIIMAIRDTELSHILPVLAVLCIGYGNSISLGTVAHYINNVFGVGQTNFSALFGVLFAISNVGNMISAPISGKIFDITGSYNLTYLISACLLVIMLVLCSIVIGMGQRAQKNKASS